LKKTKALQKNNFSSSDFIIFYFSRMLGLLPIHPKSRPAGFALPTFKNEICHANHCATGALLSRNVAFWLSLFPLAAKGWV
jgi:hypothetical protein